MSCVQTNLPCNAEVAGTKYGQRSMWQDSEDELVKTRADVSILPYWERILLVCVTEARDQLCWSKVPHHRVYLTAAIVENI